MSVVRCLRAVTDLHAAPDVTSERVSQCLFGERVEVLERAGTWRLVRNRRDGYTGHVEGRALDERAGRVGGDETGARNKSEDGGGGGRTCVVMARTTLLFAAPDLKSRVRLRVPFGAELVLAGAGAGADTADSDGGGIAAAVEPAAETDESGSGFARIVGLAGKDGDGEAFVWRGHCRAPGFRLDGTPVELARRLYEGAPYLWGGRTPDGADCSGLVQGTAFALGLVLPRDSGDQERFVEQVVPFDERRSSDLVFWPGHVGLLADPDTLYHATAHSLSTALESLADVVDRAGAPSSIRRLSLPRE